jgi:hypothetical protein
VKKRTIHVPASMRSRKIVVSVSMLIPWWMRCVAAIESKPPGAPPSSRGESRSHERNPSTGSAITCANGCCTCHFAMRFASSFEMR